MSEARLPAGPPVFTVGSRHYDRRDLVVAAILRDEWHGLEEQARQGLACVERLRQGEDEPDSLDLEQAAQEFRYARNLVSAEETEAWLARSNLTFRDWMAYLERSLLRRAWAADIEGLVSRYPVGDDELHCALHAEAVCSGELQRFAEALAGRAAVCERAPVLAGRETPLPDEILIARKSRECACALGSAGLDEPSQDLSASVAEMARLEATFQAAVRRAITTEAVQAQILAHRLDWMRVRWQYVVLPGEQAAREAALCLRHEGEALEDVAVRAGVALREEEPLLASVDGAVRAAAVSARAGDLLGPWSAADGFRLAVLLAKAIPSGNDADVRRCAEEEIAAGLVAEAMKHVVWHERI